MKKIMKFAALTFCAMFFCVFSFHTALANSTEVIKNGDIENGLTVWFYTESGLLYQGKRKSGIKSIQQNVYLGRTITGYYRKDTSR